MPQGRTEEIVNEFMDALTSDKQVSHPEPGTAAEPAAVPSAAHDAAPTGAPSGVSPEMAAQS